MTSHAIAFSFPITPNFSVVLPLMFIWSFEISTAQQYFQSFYF